ncbi:MAG: dihydrodipicolinate synthase family protein [Gammaproteobacteria bacterium]|nr:MAG: dihydrodipicolinate synthase family protein [Gammaproteobacteria bacterium]
MSRSHQSKFRGIFAATVCPMTPDFAVDEDALARHVATLVAVAGIRGFLVNGHAGENFALARDEKRRVVEITRAAAGDDAVLICGVNAESSLDAAAHARDTAAACADAIMIFPPNSWALSVAPTTVMRHHEAVIKATDLPIFLYQAPVSAGPMAYPPDVLASLVRLPRVVGIKEGSWETSAYEANRRMVRRIAPDVLVMASGDEHLLTCFVLGSDGSLLSLAAIVPELIVALDDAVRRNDLEAARAAHDAIYPLARAIYSTSPASHATARIKTCLRVLGRLTCDAVRPPAGPLPIEEIATLRVALAKAGLLDGEVASAAST